MQPLEVGNFSELEKLILSTDNMGFALPAQQSMIISCPKKMVGRVIGKNGETIKALQQFTGAQIQIDQRSDPTRVSIAGAPKAMQMATSMVQDIVAGTFKGFAMLRSYATQATKAPGALEPLGQPAPVYIEGYGFIPPSQFSDVNEGPFGYSQLQPYMNNQVPPQNSLSALSQIYSLQNQPDFSLGVPNMTQHYSGMNGLNSLEQSSQQAQMASIARSLMETPDLKMPNGVHPAAMPTSQPDMAADIYSSMGFGASSWPQPQLLSAEDASLHKHSPRHSLEHSPSRDHSPTTAEGMRPSGTQDPNALAAQLQALSLLSSYQQQQGSPSEASKQAANSKAAPTTAPAKALPHGWMQITDPQDRELYLNVMTGQTQYSMPTASQPTATAQTAETGTSALNSTASESSGFSSMGARASGPSLPKLHSNESLSARLGHRSSLPTTSARESLNMSAFQGNSLPMSLGQHMQGTTGPMVSSAETLTTVTDTVTGGGVSQGGLGQRMPETHEYKLGNGLTSAGLFQ